MELPTTESPVRLIQGDALETMRRLPDGSLDCIVTDPPFGVRSEAWDDMDGPEFARFSMAWLSEARRLAPTLVSFFASGSSFFRLVEFIYPRCRQLIWHKPLGSQYAGASESKMWFAYEPIAHCYPPERWEVVQPKGMEVAAILKAAREAKGLSRGGVDMALRGKKTGLCFRWEEAACLPTPDQAAKLKALLGMNGEFEAALQTAYAARNEVLDKMSDKSSGIAARASDVFSHRTITNGDHPCEKPVRLMADLIECTTEPGDLILDPFAGSGTTLIACLMTGRRCVGVEADAGHYATARRRADSFQGVGGLFAPVAPVAADLFAG